jgi:RNA polymerase sigma factor (sigma-70 family)
MAEPNISRRPARAHPLTDAALSPGGSVLGLARSAARGDEFAIGTLYELRFDHVYAAAQRATGRDEHFCLDVVQETFLRVLRAGASLGRLNNDAHVDRWLARVTQSAALDMLRAEYRRVRRERARSPRDEESPDPSALSMQIAALQRELESLPDADRDLLRLRASGMTLAGIAEHVGSTIGSINGRLRRVTGSLSVTEESKESKT